MKVRDIICNVDLRLIQGWCKNRKHLLESIWAVIKNRYPARHLKVIGVTGTDGKTTTTHLIYSILRKAGLLTAMVSSVAAFIGDEEIDTGFHVTTPDARFLQPFLARLVSREVKYVVLEVTSHGLDQHRVWGCNFSTGVLTNVTHEHLDYHQTFEKYLTAKGKLFRGVKMAILNRDETHFSYFKQVAKKAKMITYGIDRHADFTPKNFQFKTKLPGKHNLYNCLAAIAATSSLGIDEEIIRRAILSFKPVKGRMEEINEGQKFRAIIDFAHTPNALERALDTLRSQLPVPNSKLIVVFGCAGLRDRVKRSMMGEIAARLGDLVVLTAEDPRTEDVNEIIGQIAKGCLRNGAIEKESRCLNDLNHLNKETYFFRIPDRRKAIRFAIQKLAKKGDIVVICGKGHERSMCFGTTEYPWSDHQEARQALKERLKSKNA